jgi:hypothetical protein
MFMTLFVTFEAFCFFMAVTRVAYMITSLDHRPWLKHVLYKLFNTAALPGVLSICGSDLWFLHTLSPLGGNLSFYNANAECGEIIKNKQNF